jgi:hypothetical protein
MNLRRITACLLFCISGLAAAQQAPDGLQFNVPYLCNDGKTYVVHRCEKGPKFEACFYQHEPDSERYNTRQAVVYQMTKMCKVQGQPAAAPAPTQASAQVSSSPQSGVYRCSNGFILTIAKCDKWNGADACFFKVENKGQVLMDSPGSVPGVAKMLRACNGDTSVLQSGTQGSERSPATPSGVSQRAMDPGYLADMPPVDRVKSAIKGSDPTDTMARQVAVFTYLGEYIKRIKSNRSMRSPYTVDEQTVLNAYSLASYQISEEYKKSHTPAEASAFQSLHWKYEMGDADSWAKGLIGKQSVAAYDGALKDLAATQKAYYDAEMRTYEDATARQKEAASNPGGGADDHYAKDAGSVATRHCVESGRSEVECLGEGLKVGLKDLMGGDPLEGLVPKTPVGLRLTGWYSEGTFALQFSQDNVVLRCGDMVPQTFQYSVERSGSQFRVNVPISPKPLTLSYKLGGGMTGPGPINVDGRVVIGGAVDHVTTNYEMQTTTTTTQRQISAGEVTSYGVGDVHQNGMEYSVDAPQTSSNWVATGMQHHYEAPTAPKTERCNVAALTPTSSNANLSGALTNILGSKASRSSNTTPGLRLNGTYAVPGGLKIEFRDDSATLECEESFSADAYSLHWEGSQLTVNFHNGAGPLSLVLQPGGALSGAGNVEVAGRRAIQGAGGGVDYLPRNARCSLGTLEASQ